MRDASRVGSVVGRVTAQKEKSPRMCLWSLVFCDVMRVDVGYFWYNIIIQRQRPCVQKYKRVTAARHSLNQDLSQADYRSRPAEYSLFG